jgi:hypothetical protein
VTDAAHLPYLEIDFDGDRRLYLDVRAAMSAEEKSGQTFVELFLARGSVGTLVLLLWAGLRRDDRKLTRQGVSIMLSEWLRDGHTLEEAWEWIEEAGVRGGLLTREQESESEDGDGEEDAEGEGE